MPVDVFCPYKARKEGGLAVVISCNPIWGGSKAPRKSSLEEAERARKEKERTASVNGRTAAPCYHAEWYYPGFSVGLES